MIAFDIDSVVIDIETPLAERLAAAGYPWTDQSSFEIVTDPQIKHKDLWKIFDELFDDCRNAIYADGAGEVLDAVWKQTKEPIRFITSRPARHATATHRAIRRLLDGVPFHISFADNIKKTAFMGGITHFVEDRRRTAQEVADTGRIVYLVDKPWNRNMLPDRRIIRIDGIHELLQYLQYLPKAA